MARNKEALSRMIQRMREATRRFENGIEAIVKQHNLTLPQFEALTVMYTHPEADVNLGDIADLIKCSRGNLTGIADRLEHAGYIDRIHSKIDRRIVNIVLTDKGREVADSVTAQVDAYLVTTGAQIKALTGLTPENIDAVLAVIDEEGNAVA